MLQDAGLLDDSDYGLYPKAAVNLPGLRSVLELRAEMGFSSSRCRAGKYLDLGYYNPAV